MSSTVFCFRNLQRSAQAEIKQETKKKKRKIETRTSHFPLAFCSHLLF